MRLRRCDELDYFLFFFFSFAQIMIYLELFKILFGAN